MKKFLFMLMVLAVMGLVAPANADYYLAGDFNSWNSSGNLMTETSSGSGIFAVTLSGLAAGQRQEFKITDGTWGWGQPGPNSWYFADASGNITVTINTNTVSDGWQVAQYRLGLSVDPGSWAIAGDFNGWNNNDAMTSLGGGIYTTSKTLAAGTYGFKPFVLGRWDAQITDYGRVAWGDNMSITTTDTQVVNFYVDALAGTMKTEIVPEPATMMLLGLGSLTMLRRKK